MCTIESLPSSHKVHKLNTFIMYSPNVLACISERSHKISEMRDDQAGGIQQRVVNHSFEVNTKHLWGWATSFLPVTSLHKRFQAIRACFERPDSQLSVENVNFLLSLGTWCDFHKFHRFRIEFKCLTFRFLKSSNGFKCFRKNSVNLKARVVVGSSSLQKLFDISMRRPMHVNSTRWGYISGHNPVQKLIELKFCSTPSVHASF